MSEPSLTIKPGYCQCGCGQKTRIAAKTDRSIGHIKGTPIKFVFGHNLLCEARNKSTNSIGNTTIHSNGYVIIHIGKGNRIYEHIAIAEKALGRKLKKYNKGNPMNEVVHHINGNKQDNRPENLLICTHEYHTALHHRLEQSSNWPEFKKIIRNKSGKNGWDTRKTYKEHV